MAATAAAFGVALAAWMPAGAQQPASGPGAVARPVAASPAAEQAAQLEWKKLAEAVATGSRIPRNRYLSIAQKYPHTRAAYEANLELAKLDFDAIESQKQSARTRAPISEASKRFLSEFAYSEHAHPPMAELKSRYKAELEPLYFSAVKNIGTWQATLEYLAAYPDNANAVEIERAIESAIVNPNAGWEARDIVMTYAPIRPDRVREQQLSAQVETNLFQALNEGSARESLEKFIQAYPGSIYFANVEGMIRKQLARQISVYTDRAELEGHVAQNPGSVEGVQSKAMLDELAAQQAVFQAASSAGTVESLEDFIAENPQSRFLAEAARRIEAIKLASVSAAERASLESYKSQVDAEMRAEDTLIQSYATQLAAKSERIEQQRTEIRELQKQSNDAAAAAREQRRLAAQAGKSIARLQKMVAQNPALKDDLDTKKADQAKYAAEGKRLEGQSAGLMAQVQAKRTAAAEGETELSTLRDEAKAAQIAALGKRNRLHHEYLARLDEAWKN